VIIHTAASRLLATDQNFVNFIRVALDELLPSATRMVDAMQTWPGSQEPHECGFNLANATSEPIFKYLDSDPSRAARLAGSQKGFLDSPAFSPSHLIQGYEWGKVRKVIDVGGSEGAIAIELARAFSNLHCVVQDQPQTILGAKIPDDLHNRVELVAQDMFQGQDILDADVYLIRRVLHDWSDKYAGKILKNLVPALERNNGSVIVINDSCLPDFGTMSLYDQRFARATSLTMKAIQNGVERDRKDWERLLRVVDERLILREVKTDANAALAVMVVALHQPFSNSV